MTADVLFASVALAFVLGGGLETPRTPEEAPPGLRAPAGFTIEVFAAAPDVVRPRAAAFDERGRLWVLESHEDGAGAPGARRSDELVILERAAGGRFRRQVFAADLGLATSLVLHRDGAIVCTEAGILFLRDTDGDGTADRRETLLNGSTAVEGCLAWGADGWLHAALRAARAPGESETGPPPAPEVAGVCRFRADGNLELLAAARTGAVGIGLTADGEVLFSLSDGSHLNHVVIPERHLERLPGRSGVAMIADHATVLPSPLASTAPGPAAGGTAFRGAALAGGGIWPAELDGAVFTCETVRHVVHLDLVSPKGAILAARRWGETEFLAWPDERFQPIDCLFGPDGALYVLDLGESPTAGAGTPATAVERGRIWRVQHGAAPPLPPEAVPRLFAGPPALVSSLSHASSWVRETAARLLRERREEASGPAGTHASAREPLHAALHAAPRWEARLLALWTLQVRGELSPVDLNAALGDPHAAVRKGAARIVPLLATGGSSDFDGAREAAARLAAADPDLAVRRDAVLALADLPPAAASSRALVSALLDPAAAADPWLRLAVTAAAARDAAGFAAALRAHSRKTPGGEAARRALAPALRAAVASACRRLDPNRVGPVLPGPADAADVRLILGLAVEPWDADLRLACLEGMLEGSEENRHNRLVAIEERAVGAFAALLGETDERLRRLAIPLALRVDVAGKLAADLAPRRREILERLAARAAPASERVEAARSLALVLPGTLERDAVSRLLDPGEPIDLQLAVVDALALLWTGDGAAHLLRRWSGLTPPVRRAVLDAVLSRRSWSRSLLEAVRSPTGPFGDLPATAIYRLRNHADRRVSGEARRALAEREKARREAEAEPAAAVERLAPGVARGGGDPENGAVVFGKHCGACHQVDGKGTDIGPDVTGIGLRGAEAILADIVDPNRAVEAAYLSYAAATRDGRTFSGIVASEDAGRVVLKRSDGYDVVARADLVSLASQGKSLMPEGLEKVMSAAELRDLLAYLAPPSPHVALDLRLAASADGSRGLFTSAANTRETLPFQEYGNVVIDGIPFWILHPAGNDGRSLVVLRGGPEEAGIVAREYPPRAEIPCGAAARAVHFLGGVGGWGYPATREAVPVLWVTLRYRSGAAESAVWRNGVEIVDYAGSHNVPGSTPALRLGFRQVRRITVLPSRQEPIEVIELQSEGGPVAPVVVAVTIEKA